MHGLIKTLECDGCGGKYWCTACGFLMKLGTGDRMVCDCGFVVPAPFWCPLCLFDALAVRSIPRARQPGAAVNGAHNAADRLNRAEQENGL